MKKEYAVDVIETASGEFEIIGADATEKHVIELHYKNMDYLYGEDELVLQTNPDGTKELIPKNDGVFFNSRAEAMKYAKKTLKKMPNLLYYSVLSLYDAEKRGYKITIDK